MSHSTLSDEMLLTALCAWDLSSPVTVQRLPAGVTSEVWRVEAGEGCFIAKYADQSQEAFEGGLIAAELTEQWGIQSGIPLRTPKGARSILVEGTHGKCWPLALLQFVPGEPLNFSEPDVASLYGHLLGQTHRLLLDRLGENNLFDLYEFLLEEDEHVAAQTGLAPLIRKAIEVARDYEARNAVTFGVIWADRMEILREKETGHVGIIDWGAIERGPLLFDVALSLLWLFPENVASGEFLRAYLAIAPISAQELQGLIYYKALLWARQAKYYAYRVAANVTLGNGSPEGNAKHLAHSRQELEHLLAAM